MNYAVAMATNDKTPFFLSSEPFDVHISDKDIKTGSRFDFFFSFSGSLAEFASNPRPNQ